MRTIEEINRRLSCKAKCDDCKDYKQCEETFDSFCDDTLNYTSKIFGISLDRLEEICKAERDGRCVVLPCKVGDTVYTNRSWSGDYERLKDAPYSHEVAFIGINGERDFFHTVNIKTERMFTFEFSDISKTVFLTHEEAEEALKEANHEHDA